MHVEQVCICLHATNCFLDLEGWLSQGGPRGRAGHSRGGGASSCCLEKKRAAEFKRGRESLEDDSRPVGKINVPGFQKMDSSYLMT